MCVSEFFYYTYYTQEYKWHDLSAYLPVGEIIRFSMYIE